MRCCVLGLLSLALFGISCSASAASWPSDWADAARRAASPPAQLYAAALLASGRTEQGRSAPWPWTLRIDGALVHYASRAAAQAALTEALDQGRSVEVGLLGIPASALPEPASALHPRVNLIRGAALIEQAQAAHPGDAARALGAYRSASAREASALGAAIQVLARRFTDGAPATRIRRITASGTGTGAHAHLCVPTAKRAVADLVVAAANRYGVEPAFALAIARRESSFNQSARSPKNARGVMQLMPATAARFAVDAGDLQQNIDGGVRYLRKLMTMFDGDLRLVAAGYNAGEGAVLRFGKQVPPYRETQHYVPMVLDAREAYLQCQSVL